MDASWAFTPADNYYGNFSFLVAPWDGKRTIIGSSSVGEYQEYTIEVGITPQLPH